MTVAITCAGCRRTLRVPGDRIGQPVRCPLCIETFVAAADVVQPPPTEKQAPRARVVLAELVEDSEGEAVVATLDSETAPATGPTSEAPTRPTKPFKAVSFGVRFLHDPDRLLRDRVDAELTIDGLRVRVRSRHALWVPVLGPQPARYLGGNRLAVYLDGREVTIALVKARTDLNRLTRDVVAFLNGRRAEVNGRAYALPWKLTLLPWLALAVPFLAIWLRVLGGIHGGGRFLWFLVAGVAVLCGVKYMRREALSTGRRFAVAGSALGCCLLLLAGAFAFRLVYPNTVPTAYWRQFAPNNQRCRILMPGMPYTNMQTVAGIPNSVVHTVSVYEVEKTFSLAIGPTVPQNAWGGQRETADNYRHKLEQEILGYRYGKSETVMLKSGEVGIQVEMKLAGYSGNGHQGTQISRLFVIGDQLFTLSVIGEDVDTDDPDLKKFFGSFLLSTATVPRSPADLPGCVAHWSFDDLAPNNPAGTRYLDVGQTAGVRGRGLALNGRGHVNFDNAPNVNFGENQTFSFVAWVNSTPNQGGYILAMNGGLRGSTSIQVYLENELLVASISPAAGVDLAGIQDPRTIWPNDGDWHHVALTRGGAGKITLYLDGTEENSVQDVRLARALTTTVRSLGARRFADWDAGVHLSGALDEVAFFNRCLTAEEIAGLVRWK